MCVLFFGEDSLIQPDELFGTLDQFVTRLGEAHEEIVAQRRKEEEDKRRLEVSPDPVRVE